MTLVSVVVPVFNQQEFIGEALHSIFGQSFRDFEIVVVDDGSTDETPAILARYGKDIRVLRQPNRGGAAALNAGVRAARGEWIAWLSADDAWEPSKLEEQVNALGQSPDAGLVYTDYVYIDSAGKILSREHFPCPVPRWRRLIWLARRCYINGSSTLIRKDAFANVGLYDESDRLTPDWDLFLRIARKYNIVHVPEPLVRYRIHGGQTSARRDLMERSSRRVFSRNARRLGPALGALVATLGLIKQVRSLPAFIRRSVGHNRSFVRQFKDLLEWLVILVNPETLRAPG